MKENERKDSQKDFNATFALINWNFNWENDNQQQNK